MRLSKQIKSWFKLEHSGLKSDFSNLQLDSDQVQKFSSELVQAVRRSNMDSQQFEGLSQVSVLDLTVAVAVTIIWVLMVCRVAKTNSIRTSPGFAVLE